ncbi:MAG: hypothetical protein ACOH18_05405 [Candidatus Saccharimonadaceae bacterium]
MAKKATLLRKALKLKLIGITEKSTVPQITAALESYEATKGNPVPANASTAAPAPQKPTVAPVEAETAVESASEAQINLKDILMMYNSVVPSRRRWIMNRNMLRNQWKEFFQLLEIASGRSGQKAEILDYNWHKVIDKGGEPGLGNMERDEITVVIEDGATVLDTTAKDQKILELQAKITRLTAELANAPVVQAELEAAEIAANGYVGLGENEALPGETSTLNEGDASESTTVKKAGETPETEETTTPSE